MKRRHFLGLISGTALTFATKSYGLYLPLKDRFSAVSKHIYFLGDKKFTELKQIFNTAVTPTNPLAILQTSVTNEISLGLNIAEKNHINVSIRSGGHSFEGCSIGKGLVIDTRLSKSISVTDKSVTLQTGLNLGETQRLLAPHGFTFTTGSCPTVGVSGYLLGGGHSLKSRLWGLGADRVLSMKVILANGESVLVSPQSHADLYWAILGGGGGNFAIVQEFHIAPIISKNEIAFDFAFPSKIAGDIFSFWERWSYECPNNISTILITSSQRGKLANIRIHGVINNVDKDIENANEIFAQTIWYELHKYKPLAHRIKLRSANYVRDDGRGTAFKGSSHYADNIIGVQGFHAIKDIVEKNTVDSNLSLIFEPLGGNILNPERENSYPHRQSRYIIEYYMSLLNKKTLSAYKQVFTSTHRQLDSIFAPRSYVNYIDFDLPSDWAQRYYGDHLEKLIEVKQKYDPNHVFNFGKHSISSIVR